MATVSSALRTLASALSTAACAEAMLDGDGGAGVDVVVVEEPDFPPVDPAEEVDEPADVPEELVAGRDAVDARGTLEDGVVVVGVVVVRVVVVRVLVGVVHEPDPPPPRPGDEPPDPERGGVAAAPAVVEAETNSVVEAGADKDVLAAELLVDDPVEELVVLPLSSSDS